MRRRADAHAARAQRPPEPVVALAGWPVPAWIEFATYEHSREVVHPDVVVFPGTWKGYRHWAGITPYPNGNRHVENPSLFTSEDGDAWAVPAGVVNPLVRTTRGHLSDPDLVYDARRSTLNLFYREAIFRDGRHTEDKVSLLTSTDGVRWSRTRVLFTDRGRYVVSPSVVRTDDRWLMWQVDAGTSGCSSASTRIVMRRSWNGVRWSSPVGVVFDQPGYVPWHLDVQWVPARREYWALVAAYPRGTGCAATDLFLATSPTGERWTTYPAPVLARGTIEQFEANVYRSSLHVDGGSGQVTIWLSGARVGGLDTSGVPVFRWSAAVLRVDAADLLAHVSAPVPAPRIVTDDASLRALSALNILP